MSRALTPGSDEWRAVRRLGVTSTDIPALLGVSPWTSEGDVARDKAAEVVPDPEPDVARRLRIGRNLEDVIRAEDEVEHGIKLRRVRRFVVDPDRPLLRTSLDFERVGERVIVEAKSSVSRDWDDGLPEYVEAQVRWQMGVARYPRVHVAALLRGSELVCFDVDHDPVLFEQLVVIAVDFWARYQAGGPFAETLASVRRAWPRDDGLVISSTPDVDEAVLDLIATRRSIEGLERRKDALQTAIEMKMGPASKLVGPGYTISWKRSKDTEEVQWRDLAAAALAELDPITIDSLTAAHTVARPGTRRFLIKEDS